MGMRPSGLLGVVEIGADRHRARRDNRRCPSYSIPYRGQHAGLAGRDHPPRLVRRAAERPHTRAIHSAFGHTARSVLEEARRKINVQVNDAGPLHVTLSESELRRAAELLRVGVPVADAVRAIYPSYDNLDGMEQQAMQSLIRQATSQYTQESS